MLSSHQVIVSVEKTTATNHSLQKSWDYPLTLEFSTSAQLSLSTPGVFGVLVKYCQ